MAEYHTINSEHKESQDEADKSFDMLDFNLCTLLNDLHIKREVSALLISNNIFNLDDLAARLHPENTSNTPSALQHALPVLYHNQLSIATETRGKLLAVPIELHGKPWLTEFCANYPTLAYIYTLKYSELDNLLRQAHAGDADRRGVFDVWVDSEHAVDGDRNIRHIIKQASLPFHVIDTLEGTNNMRHFEELTEHSLDSVMSTLHKESEKRVLLELFKERIGRPLRANEITARVTALSGALADVQQLKQEVESSSMTPDQMRTKLDLINIKLSVSSAVPAHAQYTSRFWTITDEEAMHTQTATHVLSGYEKEIQQALDILKSEHVVKEDRELVAALSGGAALRGVPFGMPAHFIGAPAPRALLKLPEYCRLEHTSAPIQWSTQEFTSYTAPLLYGRALICSGRSIAALLKECGWGFSVDEPFSPRGTPVDGDEMSRDQSESTSAAISICLFVPVQSFSIGLEQMELSEEARSDVRGLGNLLDARIFFERYYSHLTAGAQHIGGILAQTISVKTGHNTPVSVLLEKATSSFSSVFADGQGPSTFLEQNGDEPQRKCEITKKSTFFGPAVANPDLFAHALHQSADTWRLIDRGGVDTLVPVWAVVGRDSDTSVSTKAPLLRRAWLDMAQAWTGLDDAILNSYIRHVAMEECGFSMGLQVKMLPSIASTNGTVEGTHDSDSTIARVNKAISVRLRSGLNFNHMTPLDVAQVVVDVCSLVNECNTHFHEDLVPALVASGSIPILIQTIARWHDEHKTRYARELLRVFITPETRARILRHPTAGRLLDADDLLFIDQSNTKPPFALVLLDSLKTLGTEANKLIDDAVTEHLTAEEESERLGVFLSVNLFREVSPQEKVLRDFLRGMLGRDFEFLEGGFFRSLTFEQISLVCSHTRNAINVFSAVELDEKQSLTSQYDSVLQFLDEAHRKLLSGAEEIFPDIVLPPVQSERVDDSNVLRYRTILLDRPHGINLPNPEAQFLDVLLHRLSLTTFGQAASPTTTSSKTWDFENAPIEDDDVENGGVDENRSTGEDSVAEEKGNLSVYQLLLSVLNKADIPAQEYILNLLLERRFAVPFLVEFSPSISDSTSFSTVHPLSFTRTPVSKDAVISICSDMSLARVAVFSLRPASQSTTAAIIKTVFACESLHYFTRASELLPAESGEATGGFPTTILEVGFGFIPVEKQNLVVLILHIIGDFKTLLSKMQENKLATVYLIEDMPKEAGRSTPSSSFAQDLADTFEDQSVLLYRPSTDTFSQPVKRYLTSKRDKVYVEFSGNIDLPTASICATMRMRTLAVSKTVATRPTPISLGDYANTQLTQNNYLQRIEKNVEDVVKTLNFEKLRPLEFALQQSFKRESDAELKAADYNVRAGYSAAVQTAAAMQRAEEIRMRKDRTPSVMQLPIIQLFIRMVVVPDATERTLYVRCFENSLSTHSLPTLVNLEKLCSEVQTAQLRSSSDASLALQEQKLRAQLVETSCHIEHLWREISHLYTANIKTPYFASLPLAAAQHLIDGFPLELMDGDAGKMNELWIKAVLTELGHLLARQHGTPPRVFVLSVLGVQSSGKSTLLNILFGCRFRVSTGMCTRGVNMMLIRTEAREEYDYVVLLDTEGVRSDTTKGTSQNKTYDNRLAAFSLWPADATIVLINGEDSSALKDILPVVGEAYQTSPLAERYGHLLVSRLFFAQRGVVKSGADFVGAVSGLRSNLYSQLQRSLADAGAIQKNNLTQSSQTLCTPMEFDYSQDLETLQGLLSPAHVDSPKKLKRSNSTTSFRPLIHESKHRRRSSTVTVSNHISSVLKTTDETVYTDLLLGALIMTKHEKVLPDPNEAVQLLIKCTVGGEDAAVARKGLLQLAAQYHAHHKASTEPTPTPGGGILGMIKDFNVNTDHVILGMHKSSYDVPFDVPNPEYGHQLRVLRETIHNRVAGALGWRARTLDEWADYLQDVWPAIMSANLALSRDSLAQRKAHEAIDAVAAKQRYLVANAYADVYNEFDRSLLTEKDAVYADVERQLDAEASQQDKNKAFVEVFQKICAKNVKSVVNRCSTVISKIGEDFPQYEEFAVITRERWTDFVLAQELQSNQRVAECITNRVFYSDIIDKYKQRVLDSITKLLQNYDAKTTAGWDIDTRNRMFNEIFTPIYEEAEQNFPPLTLDRIERSIREVYAGVRSISHDAMPVVKGAAKPSNMALTMSPSFRKQQEKDEDTLQELLRLVENEISLKTAYQNLTVHKAIDITNKQLGGDNRTSIRREAHQKVYELLVDRMTTSQRIWEKENSVPQRLRNDSRFLFATFLVRCDHRSQLQIFTSSMQERVSRNSSVLTSTFSQCAKEELIRDLMQETVWGKRKYPWAARTDGAALQALVELDLLKTLQRGDDVALMIDIQHPGQHYDRLVRRLLSIVLKELLPTTWSTLRNSIEEALKTALQAVKSVNAHRAAAFLSSLKTNKKLPAIFVDNLPQVNNFDDSLDDPADAFDQITADILSVLPPVGDQGAPFLSPLSREGTKVVDAVWKEMTTFRAGSSMKARCNVVCNVCGLGCFKERGHPGKHNTPHQPSGLNGVRSSSTREFWKFSCVADQTEKREFIHKGIRYNWDDWPKVFSAWERPSPSVPLKLREYVFYHKQDMLTHNFLGNPYYPPPIEYNHRLEDIRHELTVQSMI